MKKLARVTIKDEYLEECLGYIREHTTYCKTEQGNLTSEAYQSNEDPHIVYLISEYATPEDEKRHVESPADAAFIKKMQGKEAAPVKMFDWTQLA